MLSLLVLAGIAVYLSLYGLRPGPERPNPDRDEPAGVPLGAARNAETIAGPDMQMPAAPPLLRREGSPNAFPSGALSIYTNSTESR